jgi:hypothetical protein
MQVPPWQVFPVDAVLHGFPQLPQFASSVFLSMLQPLESALLGQCKNDPVHVKLHVEVVHAVALVFAVPHG